MKYSFKRRFLDMRQGQNIIFPLISMTNFIIIASSLTTILELIPLWLFIILFVGLIISALVVIGYFFRKIQQPTDFKLFYEKNTEEANTNKLILQALLSLTPKQDPLYEEIQERIDYLIKIGTQNFKRKK